MSESRWLRFYYIIECLIIWNSATYQIQSRQHTHTHNFQQIEGVLFLFHGSYVQRSLEESSWHSYTRCQIFKVTGQVLAHVSVYVRALGNIEWMVHIIKNSIILFLCCCHTILTFQLIRFFCSEFHDGGEQIKMVAWWKKISSVNADHLIHLIKQEPNILVTPNRVFTVGSPLNPLPPSSTNQLTLAFWRNSALWGSRCHFISRY